MASSQYLIQALQSLGAQPAAGQAAAPNVGGMQQQAQQRQAWQAANPGQSYAAHNLQQMGQNLQGVPGRIAAIPGNVASAASGLFGLGQAANPQAVPY